MVWTLPPEVVARGRMQDVPYEDAGPWAGGANCSGGSYPLVANKPN